MTKDQTESENFANYVDKYYSRKDAEYIGKYGSDGRVHIHVGHYDKKSHPEVFRQGYITPSLGEEYLRSLLREGQDRTTNMLLDRIPVGLDGCSVLDCGAGLGGSTWLMAERFKCQVSALTLSTDQYSYMLEESANMGLSTVMPILADVFSAGWPTTTYDVIIGIEAMCQMGHYPRLLERLAATQKPGGIIAVSDYFAQDTMSPIANRLNDYWVSRITTASHFLDCLTRAGYKLLSLEDTTNYQLPYWDLSIAMSMFPLSSWTKERRDESRSFHQEMRQAFENQDMRYLQLVAVKE